MKTASIRYYLTQLKTMKVGQELDIKTDLYPYFHWVIRDSNTSWRFMNDWAYTKWTAVQAAVLMFRRDIEGAIEITAKGIKSLSKRKKRK